MKYLKLYEFSDNDISTHNDFDHFINWDMIEDVKDMSLEYLDEGLTLQIMVLYDGEIIMKIVYNHKKYDIDRYVMWKHKIIKENIIYRIGLYNTSTAGGPTTFANVELIDELSNRVKEAYPEIKYLFML